MTEREIESREASELVIRRGQQIVGQSEVDWFGMRLSQVRYRRLETSRVSVAPVGLSLCLSPSFDRHAGTLILNGERSDGRVVEPGAFHLMPPGCDFVGEAVPSGDLVSYINLSFSPELLALAEELNPAALKPGLFQKDKAVADLVVQVATVAAAGDATRLYQEAAARFILATLARAACRQPDPARKTGLAPWQARKATDYLRTHLDQDVSLDDLADLVGLSTFHFARAFKRSLGVPPHRYQILLRVERAKRLLRESTLSVTEIALEVGYDSPQALARLFGKVVGVSPSQWRREAI